MSDGVHHSKTGLPATALGTELHVLIGNQRAEPQELSRLACTPAAEGREFVKKSELRIRCGDQLMTAGDWVTRVGVDAEGRPWTVIRTEAGDLLGFEAPPPCDAVATRIKIYDHYDIQYKTLSGVQRLEKSLEEMKDLVKHPEQDPPDVHEWFRQLGQAGKPRAYVTKGLQDTLRHARKKLESLGESCEVCKENDNDESMILCDKCDRGFHLYCLEPALEHVPEDEWLCEACDAKRARPTPIAAPRTTNSSRKKYTCTHCGAPKPGPASKCQQCVKSPNKQGPMIADWITKGVLIGERLLLTVDSGTLAIAVVHSQRPPKAGFETAYWVVCDGDTAETGIEMPLDELEQGREKYKAVHTDISTPRAKSPSRSALTAVNSSHTPAVDDDTQLDELDILAIRVKAVKDWNLVGRDDAVRLVLQLQHLKGYKADELWSDAHTTSELLESKFVELLELLRATEPLAPNADEMNEAKEIADRDRASLHQMQQLRDDWDGKSPYKGSTRAIDEAFAAYASSVAVRYPKLSFALQRCQHQTVINQNPEKPQDAEIGEAQQKVELSSGKHQELQNLQDEWNNGSAINDYKKRESLINKAVRQMTIEIENAKVANTPKQGVKRARDGEDTSL